jgi:protoheme IX farnesyltransferase
MLPVVAGRAETRRQILLYSIILAPVGASPWLLGYSGLLYGVTAIVAGAAMIGLSLHIMALGDEDEGLRAAKRLFGVSILYLFVLFAVLLIDHLLGAPGRALL